MAIFKNKLKDIEASLANLEVEKAELQVSHDELETENREAQIELSELRVEAEDYKNQLEAKDTELQELRDQLEAAQVDTTQNETKVAALAADTVAALGVDPVEEVEEEDIDILATFNSLSGHELVEFYQENKQAIFKAQGKNA